MSDHGIMPIPIDQARSQNPAFRALFPDSPADKLPVAADLPDDYARGLADGQHLASATNRSEIARLNALLASTQIVQNEPSEELAMLISETVIALVEQIVGVNKVDPALLNQRACATAELIAQCDAARTAWVHPDDIALIDAAQFPLALCADPMAEPGSIRIECSVGWVESKTSLYLDALRTELGRTS